MIITVCVSLMDALEAGVEPGQHKVDMLLAHMSLADRRLLGECLRTYGSEQTLVGIKLVPGNDDRRLLVPVPPPTVISHEGVIGALRRMPELIEARKNELHEQMQKDLTSLAHQERIFVDMPVLQLFPDLVQIHKQIIEGLKQARIQRGTPEAERLKHQGHLDIVDGQIKCLDWQLNRDVLEALGTDYEILKTAAQRIVEDTKHNRDLQAEWLRQHGGKKLLAKIEAGYPSASEVADLVLAEVKREVQRISKKFKFDLTSVYADDLQPRQRVSDEAFDAITALSKAGYSATAMTGLWNDADNPDEPITREVLRVFAPCPWDPSQRTYLTLELI